MKKQLLLFLLALLPLMASADAVEIDGLYYNLNVEAKTASVTYKYISSGSTSGYSDYSGDVIIPESVTYGGDTYKLESIGMEAFHGCKGLTSVIIPNGVTSIGMHAFWGCSGMTSVTIPNSVNTIERGVFLACTGLTSITIPNSVTTIDESAFNGCI